jgi:hypothetical protein
VSAVVLAPATASLDRLPAGAEVQTYRAAHDVVAALTAARTFILVSDGLEPGDHASVATAIRAAGATVIEVQSVRWDGESHSDLTAACRGVVAGFGVGALVHLLDAVQPPVAEGRGR